MPRTWKSLFVVALSILALSPGAARAGTWAAYGPKRITTGLSGTFSGTDAFNVPDPTAPYALRATASGALRSVIKLNGSPIGPNAFAANQSVVIPVALLAANSISVQIQAVIGTSLSFEIDGTDSAPPLISASVSPPPNGAGWSHTPVTVSFACSDKTSGVLNCAQPVTMTAEGATQTVFGSATDRAGNTAIASATVSLDLTAPTITATVTPPPDAAGYNDSPVTVTFTCSDALSGIASCPQPVDVKSEGSTSVTGTAVDLAGNAATISIPVNLSFNTFQIQSWLTGPSGNRKSPSGKCLDYGASPSGNGATVFLNDCAVAKPIRVVELPERDQLAPDGSTLFRLQHEVLLFAGNGVIGIHNPLTIASGGTPPPPQPVTEYQLEIQTPYYAARGLALYTPAQQIFRLDGDAIILEGSHQDASGNVVPGPCINTAASPSLCPDPPPQLVLQVKNARGANGSPLVAGLRNLADNESWDFKPIGASRRDPTSGFVRVSSSAELWNALCPAQPNGGALPTAICWPATADAWADWGKVVIVSDEPAECTYRPDLGPCVDLSAYPPIQILAGVTIRGDRRGTNPGPLLFAQRSTSNESDCGGVCMLEVQGDYARVTGLRMRGQSRSTSSVPDALRHNDAIWINSLTRADPPIQSLQTPGIPIFPLTKVINLIAIVDHNEASDWVDAAIRMTSPFSNLSVMGAECTYPGQCSYRPHCTYRGYVDLGSLPQDSYPCDEQDGTNQSLPYSPALDLPRASITQDLIGSPGSGTLGNVRVARNFLHHNMADDGGYGVGVQGRSVIEGNTFSWNRHDISAEAEPHNQYRAANNLVLSGAYAGYGGHLVGRLQDFDMHGSNAPPDYFGGAGGYFVEIARNTFLGGDGHDYVLRGYPAVRNSYHDNVSRRRENDAVHFIHCPPWLPGCINDDTASDFPIDMANNQFGQSTPDPTSRLAVGDFDGDGRDDLFLATGNTWFYSPAGQREWRYLNSAPDTIDQLLFGDFDGDGRTDVVALRNGQLVISWGGVSAFEVLNYNSPPCSSMADMAVGDFDGDGTPDLFCADGGTWWISYGGNTSFVQVIVADAARVKDLRFGDFNGDGTTDVFGVVNGALGSPAWQVRYSPAHYRGFIGGWQPLPANLTNNIDGLIVADFDGDGIADVGLPCNFGGWMFSSGGAELNPTCNFIQPATSTAVTLANGAVGRFSGGASADVLFWVYSNDQGAANLWVSRGGTGVAQQLSAQDVDMH